MIRVRGSLRDVLDRQVDYYRARAPEYDNWWNRTHQYTLAPGLRAAWADEVAELESWVDGLPLGGDVLELACGTGTWTGMLAARAASVTAVDAVAEVIEINRSKPDRSAVDFVVADVFTWVPDRTFDAVFFGFWVSHVPPPLFEDFWRALDRMLRPGGVVAFVDNLHRPGKDWPPERPSGWVQERTDLRDGSLHEVVKVFFEPDELAGRLGGLGWDADVRCTETFFLYGQARKPA